MNCETLRANLSYECMPCGRGLCVYTPFTYHDGEVIRFFAESLDARRAHLTDESDALMHLASRGVHLSRARLDYLRRLIRPVRLSDDGRIEWHGDVDALREAAPAFVGALVAASHAEIEWLPRHHPDDFRARVGEILTAGIPSHLLKHNRVVEGASGRHIEFPFLIESIPRAFIDTVHFGSGTVDWGPVSRSFAKMADLKALDPNASRRYIVIEDDVIENEGAIENAVSLLVNAAVVLPVSNHERWIETLID